MITLTPNAAEVVRSNINREKLSVDTALRLGSRTTAARIAAPNIAMWWNSIRMLFVPTITSSRAKEFGSESTARAWLIWMGSGKGPMVSNSCS